ncbi:hypothetical protein GEMRC1_003458 [Eukaryota sp. GEM-RC1]
MTPTLSKDALRLLGVVPSSSIRSESYSLSFSPKVRHIKENIAHELQKVHTQVSSVVSSPSVSLLTSESPIIAATPTATYSNISSDSSPEFDLSRYSVSSINSTEHNSDSDDDFSLIKSRTPSLSESLQIPCPLDSLIPESATHAAKKRRISIFCSLLPSIRSIITEINQSHVSDVLLARGSSLLALRGAVLLQLNSSSNPVRFTTCRAISRSLISSPIAVTRAKRSQLFIAVRSSHLNSEYLVPYSGRFAFKARSVVIYFGDDSFSNIDEYLNSFDDWFVSSSFSLPGS